jgi:integrase
MLQTFDPVGTRRDLYDGMCPELGYRTARKGSGTFFSVYKTSAGKRRRMTIGKYPGMALADARAKAQEARIQAKTGHDPAQDARDDARQKALADVDKHDRNFKALMERYIARVADHQKGGREKIRAIRKYAIAEFGNRPIDGITTLEISSFLHRLSDDSGPVMANRTSAYLSAAFKWLLRNGYINNNAASGIGRISAERERPRDHVLDDAEIQLLWRAIEKSPSSFGRIVQIALLTAQRRGTIAAMQWDDLDLDDGLWTVRGEDMKSGRAHILPLSTQVVAILKTIPRQRGPYVFGKLGSGPFSGFSKGKRRLTEVSGTKDWRPHDLRRTANTRLIGFADKDVRRRILDHVPDTRDIEALHYDQFDWLPRMRVALDELGNRIEEIVGIPEINVVPLGSKP